MFTIKTTRSLLACIFTILSSWTLLAQSAITVRSTALILSPDAASAAALTGTMDGYGAPYEVLIVPSAGVTLPQLNLTNGNANYGLFLVISQVSYSYDSGWHSALTDAQWNQMYDYQVMYGVRMIHINAYPSTQFGATALGGCCDSTVTQTAQIDSAIAAAQFPTAGLKFPAINMTGLWHYPATVSDTSTTVSFLNLGTNAQYTTKSSGGVINTFSNGRQQMVFFTSFGSWSPLSNYLNHVWINWGLFGLYGGYRRALFATQIDDLFLPSVIYGTTGTFRLRPADVTAHMSWQSSLNSKLISGGNAGSSYFIEFGFNGNGNFLYTQSIAVGTSVCAVPINFVRAETITALEYIKPLGTGTDMWPANSTFTWTLACMKKDPLVVQFMDTTTKNSFGLVSHTFTHLGEDPITYADAVREITFNQLFATTSGLKTGSKFSSKSIIPPAITGLHNGDALQAWADNGITACVGDNTRPQLMSPYSSHWPLITNVSLNGYDGFKVIPRFATRIYFNCDMANCTVAEWINTSAGSGDIFALLNLERDSTTKNLLAMMHDPYMFHQANLRYTDVDAITINGVNQKYSLLQMWVESVLNEFTQYVNWPIITKKEDDIAIDFTNRMARDQCGYYVNWTTSSDQTQITGLTVGCTNNKCSAAIPVTLPLGNTVTSVGTSTTEQIGNDPTTLWVTLTGSAKSFTLKTPIKLSAAGGAGKVSSSSSAKASSATTKASAASSGTAAASTTGSAAGASGAVSTSPATASSTNAAVVSSAAGTSPADSDSSTSTNGSAYAQSTIGSADPAAAVSAGGSPAKAKRHDAHKKHRSRHPH